MPPRVSVITGYYNRKDVLRRTVVSILEQTYHDLELIVFDDASTDGTGDALAELAADLDDPRFRYIVHEQNLGFVAGLVKAIASSSGAYIAIQGSGDVSMPNRIRRQADLLDARPEVGLVSCWYANVVEATGARRLRTPDGGTVTFKTLVEHGNVFSHGEVMFRRSTYEAAGGYRVAFKNAQDYDLWLRMIRLCRFATVPEHLYDRYIQFDGVSYQPKKLVIHGRYSILARRLATLPAHEAEPILRELQDNGPLALVPANDPRLQNKLTRGSIRSAIWGAYDDAAEIAGSYLTSPARRLTLLAFIRLLRSPAAAAARTRLLRLLSVEQGEVRASIDRPRRGMTATTGRRSPRNGKS